MNKIYQQSVITIDNKLVPVNMEGVAAQFFHVPLQAIKEYKYSETFKTYIAHHYIEVFEVEIIIMKDYQDVITAHHVLRSKEIK